MSDKVFFITETTGGKATVNLEGTDMDGFSTEFLWFVKAVDFVDNTVGRDTLELFNEIFALVVCDTLVWHKLELEWENRVRNFLSIATVLGKV